MSILTMQDNSTRRPRLDYEFRLWVLARRVWERWGDATWEYVEETCTHWREEQRAAAEEESRRWQRRYNRLETALADYTGMAKWQVHNEIAGRWPRPLRLIVQREQQEAA